MAPGTITIVHISDIHFGANPAGVEAQGPLLGARGFHDRHALAAFQTTLAALDWDVLAISGDLTFSGESSEFQAFRTWLLESHNLGPGNVFGLRLSKRQADIVVVPGGHDRYRRDDSFSHLMADLCPPSREVFIEKNGVRARIVLIDSSVPGDLKTGFVRLPQSKKAFGSDEISIALVHHPIFIPPGHSLGARAGLRNSGAVFSYISQSGFDVVLAGHTHRSFVETVSLSAMHALRPRGWMRAFKRAVKNLILKAGDGTIDFGSIRCRDGRTPSVSLLIDYLWLTQIYQMRVDGPSACPSVAAFSATVQEKMNEAGLTAGEALRQLKQTNLVMSLAPSLGEATSSLVGFNVITLTPEANKRRIWVDWKRYTGTPGPGCVFDLENEGRGAGALLRPIKAIQVPTIDTDAPLQQLIVESNSLLDHEEFASRLEELGGQICSVEVKTADGLVRGTGLLVAPNMVLTNYHVVESVIRANAMPDIACRFDFGSDGGGTPFKVSSENWLLASSPYGEGDMDPSAPEPTHNELDIALLRLDQSPIDVPLQSGRQRKCLLLTQGYEFKEGTPLFILQHPNGGPRKLALDTNGVIGLNKSRTRVRYKTNTLGGSSGSACLNQRLEFVALHHSGDPSTKIFRRAEYNQGVPVDLIRMFLVKSKINL